MSRRFQMLRKDLHVTKKYLAEKVGVDVRTITNWEKNDGTIPALEQMKSIASILHISLYEIYRCFVYKPDEIECDDIHETFFKPRNSFTQPGNWDKDVLNMLLWFHKLNLYGMGAINYCNCTFRFSHAFLRCHDVASSIDEYKTIFKQYRFSERLERVGIDLETYFSFQRAKGFNDFLPDGFILFDGQMNIIVFDLDSIKRWKLKAQAYGSITFEVEIGKAVFPEMEEEIQKRQAAIVTITFFNWDRGTLPSLSEPNIQMYRMNSSRVIGTYLKEYRVRHKLEQQNLAEILSGFDYEQTNRIDNKRISKWENGETPSATLFHNICMVLNLPEEKLLDAYYNEYFDSTYLDSNDQVYSIGLSLLFEKVTNYSTLVDFLYEFLWAKKLFSYIYENDNILGELSFSNSAPIQYKDGFIITRVELKENAILLYERNNSRITIRPQLIASLHPFSTHANYCYDFKCSLRLDSIEYDCNMKFSFIMSLSELPKK